MGEDRGTRVIGTAGHVDHGKSVLVKALTGIDPDRLKEEKEREMTIDLGFAWFTLPSGLVVSVIDVPGHEDFIKNMLAGVGGIDAVLLVVAADEGVMPQTVEHLAILDLLEVRRGVVALAKVDLVEDEEWLELVAADVERLLKGTTLADSKILLLSAVTGQGFPSLIEALDSLLSQTPPRRERGRPRLPIDRAFTLAGFGTVVTGTLIDGRLRVGQEVEILPQGLKSRIRGLQTHKEKIEVAVPGSRVAINLVGVGKDELRRGDVVSSPGWLEPTRLVDVRLRMLGSAPKPLRHNISVDFYSGAAQIAAKARVLGAKAIEPAEEGWVQLVLTRPTALLSHDRFIIRQPSPSLTIGGGTVVDPHPRRRHKRFRPQVIERLEALALGTPQEVLLTALEEGPQEMGRLVRDSRLGPEVVEEALERLLEGSRILVLGASEGQLLVSSTWWEGFLGRLFHLIEEYHSRYPLRLGMPREEVKSKLRFSSRLFNGLIGQAVKEGAVAQKEATLKLPGHEVRLTPEEEGRVERLLSKFSQEPYTTPSVADCQAALGEEVLSALLKQGRVVQVSENTLFLASTYEVMVERVVEHLKKEGAITLAQVRDLFSTSRKYAQAFLEHLDAQGITRRVGDERVLR
ncbi:MAG: selenocysteine-specific translation elongation factor [Anaerolineae bacterium]